MTAIIAAYLGGIATGVTLLLAHQYSVRRATTRLQEEYRTRRENARLRAENEELRGIVDARERCDEAVHARQQGKILGMQERRNQSAYDKFARAVNPDGQRKVKVGNPYGFPSSPVGEPPRSNQRFERDAQVGGGAK